MIFYFGDGEHGRGGGCNHRILNMEFSEQFDSFACETFVLDDGSEAQLTPPSVEETFVENDTAKMTKLLQGPMDANSYNVVNGTMDAKAPGNQQAWMHSVAANASLDMLKAFVESGGDVNLEHGGLTPIVSALEGNKPDNCQYLIEKGANVTVNDYFGRSLVANLDRLVETNQKYKTMDGMEVMVWSDEVYKTWADLRALLVSKGVTE